MIFLHGGNQKKMLKYIIIFIVALIISMFGACSLSNAGSITGTVTLIKLQLNAQEALYECLKAGGDCSDTQEFADECDSYNLLPEECIYDKELMR